MKSMTIDEFRFILKVIETEKNSTNKYMFKNAKYITPTIDTRFDCVFSIKIVPWFGKEYVLDYRDESEFETFFGYVLEKLNLEKYYCL